MYRKIYQSIQGGFEVSIGNAVSHLLESEEMTQVQMAMDLNLSEQMISHIKNGRRKMADDIAIASIKKYDAPFYILEILHEFSDRCSPPVFRGGSVEKHRLAFEETVVHEAHEAIRILEEVSFVKSPQYITYEERNRVKEAIGELLDVEAWVKNLIAILSAEYSISMKDSYNQRVATWKARGWLEK
jgi:transcriptional regulator with XRE-family HTH domain